MRSPFPALVTVVVVFVATLAVAVGAVAQTPEQPYFDWASLDFNPSEYEGRRTRVMAELATLGAGPLIVPSANGVSHGPTFRQLDDFHYLTGLELPGSVLVMDPADGSTVVYAPGRDARFANPGRPNDFPGRSLADDPDLARRSGVVIRDRSRLDGALDAATRAVGAVWLNLGGGGRAQNVETGFTADLSPDEMVVLHLRQTLPRLSVRNAFPAIARVRAVKSPAEVAIIRRLARLTEDAIERAAARVRPGVDERTLEGWFELGCKEAGAQRIPFHPIVKSGPNSLWPWRILAAHYDRRNRAVEPGDLVIFDVGCELDHFVSDVGRTFPVSGSFTTEQAEVLEMQREVSAAIIAAIRPGATLADVTRAGMEAIPAAARPYMQTGSFFSHHLGLSTGDPVLTDEPLRPGMVFTVEPWYYNHDTGISVFVEDMVLVTEDGVELLTDRLPRSVAGLEAMVR